MIINEYCVEAKLINIQEQNSADTAITDTDMENSLSNQVNHHQIPLNQSSTAIVLPRMTAIVPETYVENTEQEVAKIYLQQAQAYYAQQHWQESIHACQQALKNCPDLAEVYKVYGNSLQQMGRLAEAMGYYAQAIAKEPQMAEVYANVGSIYAKQCQWKQAIDYYQKALTLDPNLTKVYLHLSRIWEKLEEDERALDCLLRALNSEPEIFTSQQHLQLADDLFEKGKVELAINCYEHAVQLEPNFKDAYLKLIKALEKNNQWQKASTYYREIIRLQAAESEANSSDSTSGKKPKIQQLLSNNKIVTTNYLLPGKLHNTPASSNREINANNQTESNINFTINQYLNQLKKEPNSSAIRVSLGNLFARQQQWQQARSYYQQAIKLDPNLGIAYIKLGKVYGIIGKTVEGAELIYRGYSLQPEAISPEEHFKLGNFLLKHDKTQLAMSCYRYAIQLKPNFSEARHKLQNLIDTEVGKQEQVKLINSSESNSQALNKAEPKQLSPQPPNKHQIDQTKLKEQSLSVSDDNYQPEESKLYFDTGIAAEKEENWDFAYECYQKSIKSNPTYWEAYNQAGEILRKQKKWQQSIKFYQQAIKKDPQNFFFHHNLGEAYLEIQQWQAAVDAYRKSIALKQDFSWSHYKLGSALMELKQWQQAGDAINNSIKLNYNFDWAHHKLGNIYTNLKNWDEAVRAYRTALQITPDLPKTEEKLIDVLRRRCEADCQQIEKFYNEAIQVKPEQESLYFKALEIKPNNPDYYVKLAEIYVSKKQKKLALSFYKIALQINPDNSEVKSKLKALQA